MVVATKVVERIMSLCLLEVYAGMKCTNVPMIPFGFVGCFALISSVLIGSRVNCLL